MGMPIRERPRPDHWPKDDLASLVRDLADAHNHLKAVIEDRRALMDRLICQDCSRDVAHVLGALLVACRTLEEIVREQNLRLSIDYLDDPFTH